MRENALAQTAAFRYDIRRSVMIMTERLYYDDAYLTEFDAEVTACEAREDGYYVRLNRSAFYPTSGGQPFDTGTLGGALVKDVCVMEDGDVAHVVDRPLMIRSPEV